MSDEVEKILAHMTSEWGGLAMRLAEVEAIEALIDAKLRASGALCRPDHDWMYDFAYRTCKTCGFCEPRP